jgi:hypothetical protein
MVERHEHHDGAAHDVDRRDARDSFARHGRPVGVEWGDRWLLNRGTVWHAPSLAA